MRARVEKNDTAGGGRTERADHAIEVEAFRLRGEVGVVGEAEADVCEDLVVVGPCWAGEVDCGLCGVEFGEEEAA